MIDWTNRIASQLWCLCISPPCTLPTPPPHTHPHAYLHTLLLRARLLNLPVICRYSFVWWASVIRKAFPLPCPSKKFQMQLEETKLLRAEGKAIYLLIVFILFLIVFWFHYHFNSNLFLITLFFIPSCPIFTSGFLSNSQHLKNLFQHFCDSLLYFPWK